MHQSEQDDPNISEVKAVLERLQQISRSRNTGGLESPGKDYAATRHAPRPAERPVAELESGRTAPHSIATSDQPVNIPKRRRAAAAAVIAGLLVASVGVYVLFGLTHQTDSIVEPLLDGALKGSIAAAPGSAMVQPADLSVTPARPLVSQTPKSQAALQAASGFIATGRIQAARAELLQVAQEGSPDVAWALARSYDPNFLSTISTADAGPNTVEATRWYRIWYDIAVKQGLIAESISLERIIRAMQ
jgi:hypothetical protein